MAGKLKSEDLALNIIVNGNKAQSEIGQLGRSVQDTKAKIKDLETEQRRLEKQGQKNTQRYRDLTKQIQQHNSVLDYSRSRLKELNQSLSLEDKTIKQLNSTLRELRRLRDQTVPGTDQYKAYNDQIAEASARLSFLRNEADRTGNVLTRMGGGIKSFFASTLGGIASVTALAMGVARARDEYARFDDKIADVMKTTNASKESVRELNAELEKIDTRTSQDDLLGLGRIGGKLGITDMDELRGFVEATNQLVVALNEDLGGDVEGTVSAVGKLVDIFGIKEMVGMEQGLLKVGSAINELGMASTANEGYMVEFSRRMAGVAPLAGITVQQILGLGATLDQLAQTSEVSSTALSKLFLKLASDAESFAKYAGMEVTAFKDLLEKDFMAAFTAVLKGVRNNANGINELAATLGDLELDGGRVIGVLGSLANNTHILTDQINLANEAFEKGTSLTEEYGIKNSTAQAQLEKKRKEVTRLWRELGEQLWPVITTGNNLLIVLARTLSTVIGFISDNIRVITVLTVTLTAYTIAANSARIATLALATGQRIITAAQWAWNAALAANPIGIVIAGVTALTAAITMYSRRLSAASFAQKTLSDITREANKETNAEAKTVQRLQAILEDNTRSISEKTGAVKALRDIMPDVLNQYTDEEIRLGKATDAMNKHIATLKEQAKVRVSQQKIEDLMRRRMKIEEGSVGFMTSLNIGIARLTGRSAGDVIADELSAIDAAIDALTNSIVETHADNTNEVVQVLDESLDNNVNTVAGKRKELEDEIARLKVAYEHLATTDINARQKNLAQRQALQKQLDALDGKTGAPGAARKSSAETQAERDQKAQEKLLEDQRKYREQVLLNSKTLIEQEEIQHQERLKQAGIFGLNRELMTKEQLSVLEELERTHALNRGKIDAQAMRQEIELRQQTYQDELTELRIRNNEELAEIRTLEQAKVKLAGSLSPEALSQIKTLNQAKRILQNQHQQEEERLTRAHLQQLNELIQSVMDSGEWEGIDLADKILSDEERKLLEDNIRKIREELSKLRNRDLTDEAEDSTRGKTDILGMSVSDWDLLFENLRKGKISIEDIMNVWGLASQAWNQYNAFVAAGEKRRFQEYEESNRRQRETLDKRLKAGAISQEQYNARVEKLDKDLAKKKARMEYEQAKRERSVALMSAIVSTAAGVARAFKDFSFPYSAIIAGVVGGLGALQIGTIARQPLPSLSGREDGGYLVRRSQDGKVFNASHDPDRRGYVGKPTVIVGENGNEFVANAEAVSNPSVRPILDIIDTAQRNGTISTLQLENILPRARDLRTAIPGRQSGGSLSAPATPGVSPADLTAMNQLLDKATQTMDRLDKTIARGIKAEVALLGKNGFYEKDQEYKDIQNGANL